MRTATRTAGRVRLEVVEINPVIDEQERTALLGVGLVLSGLGQKIL
jgi:arginase family enzyme